MRVRRRRDGEDLLARGQTLLRALAQLQPHRHQLLSAGQHRGVANLVWAQDRTAGQIGQRGLAQQRPILRAHHRHLRSDHHIGGGEVRCRQGGPGLYVPSKDDPTLGKLVADASRDVSALLRGEIALAKSELKLSVKAGGLGLGLFAAAAFIAVLALTR